MKKENDMNRSGLFLVRACYVAAGLVAAYPLVLIPFDWNDPGHLKRLLVCLPAALVIAVLGKILACLPACLLAITNRGNK